MTAQRIAIVTGANRGIGLEIARQLAGREITVILTARDRVKAEAAAGTIKGDAIPHQLDVTDADSIRTLRGFVERRFDRLDILVNNAGILLDEGADIATVSIDTIRQTFETNLFGAWQMAQAFLPLMKKHNYGRIVNVSSTAGQFEALEESVYAPAYAVSKAALNGLTAQLGAELRGTNILVNAVCPGWVRTDMGGPSAPRSVQEGAATPVWLALLPDDAVSGKFFEDLQVIAW